MLRRTLPRVNSNRSKPAAGVLVQQRRQVGEVRGHLYPYGVAVEALVVRQPIVKRMPDSQIMLVKLGHGLGAGG